MGQFEEILADRLSLLSDIKAKFMELYPDPPKRIRRGECQKDILESVCRATHGYNRRAVSEALEEFGYRKGKIQGHFYYLKTP